MRIGIDARMYREGLGIGRYIEKIIGGLEKLDTPLFFVIFMTKKNWHCYTPVNPQFRKVCVNVSWYGIGEQIILPFFLIRERLDVVHFPHFNVPLLYPRRFIVTIHDCIMIKHPASSTSAASTRSVLIHWLKYQAFRLILSRAVLRASMVITVSKAVRDDLTRYLGVAKEKVAVIYEAADMEVGVVPCSLSPDTYAQPFYLYAGNAYPHKNLETLLNAFKGVQAQYSDCQLLLCGQDDFFRKKLLATIKEKKLESSVHHLGTVSDSCLSLLYSNAIAFVFPSLEEGFGLPALEAFIHGCPVIASDIQVFREICGSAAYLVDTTHSQPLMLAMKNLIQDPSLREWYKEKGRDRVSDFSWDATVRQTLACYQKFL